jgi:putative sterol carrier protein
VPSARRRRPSGWPRRSRRRWPGASRRARPTRTTSGQRLAARGERAFGAFVRHSDDARLEKTVGSDAGLRMIFSGMAQRFVPEKANGFTGELQYELSGANGAVKHWVVAIVGDRARVRSGVASTPRLTIRLSLADFARMAGNDLDPGKALLTGRMELAGDLAVAPRLGEMFGQDPAI